MPLLYNTSLLCYARSNYLFVISTGNSTDETDGIKDSQITQVTVQAKDFMICKRLLMHIANKFSSQHELVQSRCVYIINNALKFSTYETLLIAYQTFADLRINTH